MYPEIWIKKLSSHCSNAVGANVSFHREMYSDRIVYNSSFVESKLLQPSYIRSMLSLCKYVKPNVSFADVLRREQRVLMGKNSLNLGNKGCEIKNAKGKNYVHSGNVLTNISVHKRGKAVVQNQSSKGRYSKVVQGVQSAGMQNRPVSNDMNNQFIHVNRFQPLVGHIESNIVNNCHSVVENDVVRETRNVSTVVSVYSKDGKGNKGKKLYNAHPVAGANMKELGSSKCPSGTGLGSAKCSKTNETDIRACNTHIPALDSEIQHLKSANCALKRFNDTEGEGRTETVSLRDSSGPLNDQESRLASRTEEKGLCDKYALEIHVSCKKNDRIQLARAAPDNSKCITQNRPLFGFIPIYGLKSRVYDHKDNPECTDIIAVHKQLRADGRHNFAGLQIPISSKLNHGKWAQYLVDYWDWQLPLLIKFGFPLDFDRNSVIINQEVNHKSALDYPDHVDTYLREEIDNKAMLGPYKDSPIENLHISPFMTRDKANSVNRRVIIDLSWPHGGSVNAGVPSDRYLGTDFVLTYPSVDNITQEVLKLGRGCKIFKVDISRAFRHVPIDPGDLDLLGLHWKDYFIDFSVPFGFKHGSSIFQRISDAVRFIMKQEGHSIWNYIDDFLCVSLPSKIDHSYSRLQELLSGLGLTVSAKKLVPPGTKVICLAILVDTVDLSVSIPEEKLQLLKDTCKKWSSKHVCTKRELQSLLGLLLYVAKCIKYARFFLNRMLQLLRDNGHSKHISLTEEFKRDLKWFNSFLPVFNGVSFFNYIPSRIIHLDACPSGLGAIFDNQVYALPLPGRWKDQNIAYTELINVLVALKVWHREWTGLRVLIKCDNQSVVSVLNTGRTRDRVMAKFVRNIYLWLSAFNIDIQVVHVPGKLNPVADLLSRWYCTHDNVRKLKELVHPVTWLTVTQELLHVDESI